MSKGKGLMVICISGFLMLAGVLAFGILSVSKTRNTFSKDGYILSVSSEEGKNVLNVEYFSSGASYRSDYENKLVFNNSQGKNVEYEGNSLYTHFQDGGISAVKEGIILDIGELDKGFLNLYYITPESILEKNGESYFVRSGNSKLEFSSLLWKISDNKFLLAGSNYEIYFPNKESLQPDSFIEIEKLEDGIIRYMTEEEVYHTLAAGATVVFHNGTSIDLNNGLISTPGSSKTVNMDDLRIDSEDAIVIGKPVVLPEFDIQTIDGEEGSKGTEGKSGVNGNKGVTGLIGENGVDGSDGTDGTGGANSEAGSTGLRGISGSSGDEAAVAQTTESIPTFVMSDTLQVTETSISGSIIMETEDEDGVLVGDSTNNKICLYNSDTGLLVEEIPTDFSTFFEQNFLFTNLEPNTKYRIILMYQYELERSGVSGVREFLSKVVYTDGTGLVMNVSGLDTDRASIQVKKQEWSEAESFSLRYQKQGGPELTTPVVVTQTGDSFQVELLGLDPDTEYEVTMLASNGVGRNTLKFTTLKRKPVIDILDGLRVLTNARGYFEIEFQGTVTDMDGGIDSYRYDIFEINGLGHENFVKTVQSETQDMLALGIDNIDIKRGTQYIAKGYINFHDNEKNVVYELGSSNTFIMRENGIPVVSFNPSQIRYDAITGTIRFDITDCDINISNAYPVTVNVYADGIYKNTLTFGNGDYLAQRSVPISLIALKRDTEYAFSVTGYAKVNGTSYTKCNWGSFRVKTGSPNVINVIMQEDLEGTAAVNAKLILGDTSTIGTLEYQTLTCIEIQMLNQAGQVLGTSYTVIDTNSDMNVSTISQDYWGTGNYIRINENNFGLSAASLSGLQKVKFQVSAMYDYTYSRDYRDNNTNLSDYKNQLDYSVSTSFVEVEKVKTPPSLPTGAYMGVVAIQNMAVNAYRQSTSTDANLKEDTIVGYSLTPAYANDSLLAEVVHYYVYDAEEFRKFLTDNATNLSSASYPNVTTGVVSLGANKVEPLVVYQYGTLGTKIDKVYLPKLNLLFGAGDTTLTDETTLYNSSDTRRIFSAYMGEECKRGREYFFVYCVEWEREGATNFVYPYSHANYDQSLRFEAPQLLQSTGVKVDGIQWKAYRQEPQYLFYPYTSGEKNTIVEGISQKTGTITWKYKILDPDHAMASYYSVADNYDLAAKSVSTGGIVSALRFFGETGSTVQLSGTDHSNYDLITVCGLTPGQTAYLMKRQCLLYQTLSTPLEQVAQVYDGEYSFDSTDFLVQFERVVEGSEKKNQYNITLTSSRSLDRVVMLGIRFKNDSGVPFEEKLTYLQVMGYADNKITLELPFSSFPASLLSTIANTMGATVVKTEVYVFYDTGEEGIKAYEVERTPSVSFPTYPIAMQLVTDGTTAKEKGQYQVLKSSAAGTTLNTTGSNKPVNALLLMNSNISVAGDSYFITLNSVINNTISRTIGYHITQFGAEMISAESESTSLYAMPKKVSYVAANQGLVSTLQIDGMKPTLSGMASSTGLNSADISFKLDEGSRAIIKTASGGTGSYCVKYWELAAPDTIYTKTIPLETTELQQFSLTGLRKAAAYNYKIYYMEGIYEKEVLDSRDGRARPYNFITQNRVIVNITNVTYIANTYEDKSVTTQFSLSTVGGYQISYSVRDNTSEISYDSTQPGSPLIDLADPGNTEGALSVYKLKASPGSIFINGHSYTIKILAYTTIDGPLEELGSASYDFAIPIANEPAFVVRSVPSTSGTENRLTVYIDAADNSKTLVTRNANGAEVAEYCVKLTDLTTHQLVDLKNNSSLATSTYGVSYDASRNLFFIDALTARSKAFTVRGLAENREYLLELYSAIDLQNAGGKNAIYACTIPCTTSNLVKSQTMSTTNEFGIKAGAMRADIAGSNITIRFNDSAYLERITTLMYTITNLDDGSFVPISGQLTKVGDDPLLTQNPSVTSTYSIQIPKPVSLEVNSSYAITVALRINNVTVATMTDTFWY